MDRPPGNVAVDTDDAKGIGAATCERLAREGAYVAVDDGDGQRVVDEIIEASGTAVSWHLDVTDEAAVASTLGDVVRAWGRLDVMVNNAGTNADRMFHKMSRDDWFRVVQVDLGSMLNMTRPVINGMRSREYGHIVNVSSVNAQKGQVGRTNYCAAKAGGPGLTRALALESAAKNITVNAVAPGYADTRMVRALPEDVPQRIVGQVPVGRLAQPHEIARCSAFLASEDAGHVTGTTLAANGGLHLA